MVAERRIADVERRSEYCRGFVKAGVQSNDTEVAELRCASEGINARASSIEATYLRRSTRVRSPSGGDLQAAVGDIDRSENDLAARFDSFTLAAATASRVAEEKAQQVKESSESVVARTIWKNIHATASCEKMCNMGRGELWALHASLREGYGSVCRVRESDKKRR